MPHKRLIVGVLLAAGAGRRFGGDKLLASLPDGRSVCEAALAALAPAVDRLIVVVRAGADVLAARCRAAGADVCVCPEAARGMGASLGYGVRQAVEADGWLIALADMPLVATNDILSVAAALRAGAPIAVPVVAGRRGHPVGFARCFGTELAHLDGDIGARHILNAHAAEIIEIKVNASSWLDVDTPADLAVIKGTAPSLRSAHIGESKEDLQALKAA